MDRPRDQFLPRTAFALDEDGGVGIGYIRDQFVDLLHPAILPQEVSKTVSFLQGLGEKNILVPFSLQLVMEVFDAEHDSNLC